MPQSQTGGLSEHLALKREAGVMVTRNFDIKDRLLDGRIGLVSYFKHKGGKITEIYVKLDDRKAGKVARSNDNYNKVNGAAPVRMVDVHSIKLHSQMINCKRVQFPVTLPWGCTVDKV